MRKSKVQSLNAHLLESPEWLKEHYIDKNLSLKAIGKLIPCSTLTVRRKMAKYGIAIKPKYITYGEIKLNPAFGERNGNWSGGKHKCPDCNIVLGYRYSKSGKPVKCIKCSGLSRRKPKKEQPDDFIRHSADYRDWRNMVFIRDSYKCQICGINNNNLKAHHLDGFSISPEKRFDVANGVTLCNDHHIQFHKEYGFGGNTKEQFDEFASITEVTF
jgi:HNH endonuclease